MDADNSDNPTHASVIIGWDKTKDGTPYWILRNTYGPDFGMHGDMHIPLGINAFNIEKTIMVFDVEGL